MAAAVDRRGKDLSTVSRTPVPMTELVWFHHDLRRQLGEYSGPFQVRFDTEPPGSPS